MKKQSNHSVFYVCLFTSIALIVGGFLVPPTGIIDGSVITAVGLLLGFAVIDMTPETVKSAKSTKVTTMGGTTIEVNNKESKKEDQNERD